MTVVRTLAEFRSTLPNDQIEPPEGGISQFGGRTVCTALLELLLEHGFLIDIIRYAGDHGWEAEANAKDGEIWIQISPMGDDEFILLTKYSAYKPWFKPIVGRNAAEVLTLLDQEMKADGRFSEIRWYAQDKNGNQSDASSPTPVG
jgi:hypothetical protein